MQPSLLLEGVSFHFDEDGDEMGDDEFDVLAEGLAEDGPLSSSTLEILIEHFSSDGLGADGPTFDDDDGHYHHQQHALHFASGEDGGDNARDASGPSPQV